MTFIFCIEVNLDLGYVGQSHRSNVKVKCQKSSFTWGLPCFKVKVKGQGQGQSSRTQW